MKKVYSPGKFDYNHTGRKNCLVTLEWELKDGRFTMSGNVWNHIKTDIYQGGQMCDEVAKMFPHDKIVQRMFAVWERYHLNDMKAGTPAQEAFLKEAQISAPYPLSHYDVARVRLAIANLNPDNGYAYGSAWLREEIPADVIAEINSWPTTEGVPA